MIAAMPQFFWGWTGVLSHCLIPCRSLVLPLSLRFQPRDPAEEAAAVAFPVGPEVMMVVRPSYVFLWWRCNHSPEPRSPLVVPGVTQCLQGPCLPQQRASRVWPVRAPSSPAGSPAVSLHSQKAKSEYSYYVIFVRTVADFEIQVNTYFRWVYYQCIFLVEDATAIRRPVCPTWHLPAL